MPSILALLLTSRTKCWSFSYVFMPSLLYGVMVGGGISVLP